MSKKRPPTPPKPTFRRKVIKPFRDASIILVASEGEKTEKQYFEFSFFRHRKVVIETIPSKDGKSAPNWVLENLKDAVKKRSLSHKQQDHLWVVIDRDEWKPEDLLELKNQRCESLPINIALSNPCFELWLLLHHAALPEKPLSCQNDALVNELRTILGEYNKSNLKEEHYIHGLDHAIAEAKKTTYESSGFPSNPGTDVYKLVELIQSLRPSKSKL